MKFWWNIWSPLQIQDLVWIVIFFKKNCLRHREKQRVKSHDHSLLKDIFYTSNHLVMVNIYNLLLNLHQVWYTKLVWILEYFHDFCFLSYKVKIGKLAK